MSHVHIPDGVLPVWLWAPGWAAALLLVYAASRASTRVDVRRKVPLLGVVSALMLVAMSSEIVPIAYHVNLTVVGGVLLGPVLSPIAAFITEVVLSMLGHGGVTVLGLNALIASAEMSLGWLLFRASVLTLGRARTRWSAALATVATLMVTTAMLVGVVALAGGAAARRETGALDPRSLSFKNPFAGGIYRVGLMRDGEEGKRGEGSVAGEPTLSLGRFAAVVFTLGPIGWLIEALVTAGVLGYVARVRPTLVFSGALAETGHALPGDEHGRH